MEALNIPRLAHLLEPQSRRSQYRIRCAEPGRSRKKARPVFTLTANAATLPANLFINTPVTPVPAPAAGTVQGRSGATKDSIFRSLVKEYGASLYYFVLKRVGHPDDAADIAQQAFVEAACSLTSYRGEAELSTWIFGIATNLARNHVSRAPQHRHRFETDDILEGCESPDLQPCESLSQRQALELVSEAMEQMPPEMARALNLVTIEDLSYEEAAEELDVPVGTVRSRVSRARAVVREHLRSAGYLAA